MKTTLNKIREHDPCERSWKKLLNNLNKTKADDEPLEIKTILDINGFEDAAWALRAVDGHDKDIRLFVCDCAESVLHLFENKFPDDSRPRKAIEIARKFANGECNNDELIAANDAARDSAKSAYASNPLSNTFWCAYAASDAASDASWYASNALWNVSNALWNAAEATIDAEKKKQVEFFMKYI